MLLGTQHESGAYAKLSLRGVRDEAISHDNAPAILHLYHGGFISVFCVQHAPS